MLSQLRKHLFKWSSQTLSLAGRIMIANQVVLSSIWYLASCTDLSSKALKLASAYGQEEENRALEHVSDGIQQFYP